jgi:hypothetical protein
MDEIHMVREGNHLVPVDEMSSEELARLPLRQQVLVKVTMPRNLRQHRLAWALATKVAEACDWLHDRDDSMAWLKIKARHVRYIHDTHSGETQIVPKSIRFAALDQMGFDRIFKRMVYVTVTEIIPGMDETALRAEIESMVGVDTAPPEVAPTKEPKRRGRPPKPRDPIEPISIIPDNTFPGDRPLPELPNADGPLAHPSASPAPLHSPAAQEAATVQALHPKTATEWAAYCRTWLAEYEKDPTKTDQDAMLRWNNERALRNDCGVTSDERQPLFVEYGNTIERMRGR